MALAPIGLLYLATLVRLIMLQGHFGVTDVDELVESEIVLPAARGSILDRHDRVLAEDVNTWELMVTFPPKHRSLVQAIGDWKYTQAEVEEKVRLLADGVGVPFERLWVALLVDRNSWQVLRSGISPAERESIKKAMAVVPYSGLALMQKFERVYPQGAVLGHVIGMPPGDAEDKHSTAGNGLERGLDSLLAGTDGSRRAIAVSRQHGVNPALGMVEPVPGQSVRTTLDAELSAVARRELGKLKEEHDPFQCFAVAVDVHTGEILTMTGLPDYDPNDPLGTMEKHVHPVTGEEELEGWTYPGLWRISPGSTFKPLMAAYALSRGSIDPEQWFENHGGKFRVPRRVEILNNSPNTPTEPMRAFEGIVHSSNVVFAQIARAVGREGMAGMLEHFGYHMESRRLPGLALDLQGRSSLPQRAAFFKERSPDGMAYTIPTMGFGKGFEVPPLDHAMALASIANGGWLMEPTLDPRNLQRGRRRILEEEATVYVREAMHGMVMLDHRKWLPHREEFRYAGKSGTSTILGGVFKGRYTSLFTAFGPVEDPQVLVLVVAYGTQKSAPGGLHHYGSRVSGPAAANILRHALRKRGHLATNSAQTLDSWASEATLQRD
jgi:cell division protein FtsI (penicillin-binding protein 3)